MAQDKILRDRSRWFSSRFGMTEAEFRRRTNGFLHMFQEGGHLVRIGDEKDGALEVLRKLQVIG
jgi:hypothetical protein